MVVSNRTCTDLNPVKCNKTNCGLILNGRSIYLWGLWPFKEEEGCSEMLSSYLISNVTELRTAHLVPPKVTRPKWTAQIRYDWMRSLNPGTSRSWDPLYKGSLSISFFSRYFLHLEFRRILFNCAISLQVNSWGRALVGGEFAMQLGDD